MLEEFTASAFRGDIETIQKNIHLLSIGRVRNQLKEKNFLAKLQNSQGKIFEICLKGLNPPSNDCERFLSTAIAQKNFDLVFFLVSERKTNISLGHLKAALRSNENTSIRIANYLIENKKNDFLITPHDLLNLSGAKKSV